jgi:hypothetical protein
MLAAERPRFDVRFLERTHRALVPPLNGQSSRMRLASEHLVLAPAAHP